MSTLTRAVAAIHRRPERRPRAVRIGAATEALEDRILLAGDVAAIVADGNLSLAGDDESNSVEVTHTAEGVLVRGLDGTTINGSAAAFVAFPDEDALPGNLQIDLGEADDVIQLSSDLRVTGDVRVDTGQGVDKVGLDGVMLDGDFSLHGGPDATFIYINDSIIGGDVRLSVGSGDNIIALTNASVGDDLKVQSRSGETAVLVQSTVVGDDARLHLGQDDDSLLFETVTIGDQVRVHTGSGADFAMFDASLVNGRARIHLGNDADSLVLSGQTAFAQKFRADGGPGSDAAGVEATSTFDGRHREQRYESDQVPAAEIDGRLNDPVTGLITRTDTLADEFSDAAPSELTLTAEVANLIDPVPSNDTLIVDTSQVTIRVTTAPGAAIEIDRDGHNAFSDGAAVADSNSVALSTVTPVHSGTNHGANAFRIRATLGGGGIIQ